MILTLLLAAATPTADPRAATTAFFAAFNRRDLAAMEALYAPHARLTSSDFCAPRGRADVRRTYRALFDAHPDVRDEVEAMVVEGDRVAVRFRARGASLDLHLMTFLRFERGLIVADDTIFDTRGAPCER
jgi:ketosteroid isomerase-like protein